MSWIDLKESEDYEIFSEFPHEIRRKSTGRIITFGKNNYGYIRCFLNGKQFYVHRIVANTFIDNPESKPFVDHINGDTTDYHIENLRWVNNKENLLNLYSAKGVPYEFVDELEADSYSIDAVGDWDFEGFYVCGTNILRFDGVKYRILIKHENGRQWAVSMRDVNGIFRLITKKRLEKALAEEYDLEFDLD